MAKNRVMLLITLALVQTSPLILDKLPPLIRAVKETPQLTEKEPPQLTEKEPPQSAEKN
jgi:hypothetical protein